VDIFGLPHDAEAIYAIAKKHGLIVIEDTAQAPGARFKDKFAGTIGDIGVYSLNYHKHIHCGEGGIIVTDNDELAEKMRLIRNHAEAVVEEKGTTDLVNMVGYNYRMTEIEAAISRSQLKKLGTLLQERQNNCAYLTEQLAQIPAILPPKIRNECTHAYYVFPCRFDEDIAGVSRNKFIDAVRAELPPTTLREDEGALLSYGYVKPLYLQPLYQKQIAYGTAGFPFKSAANKSRVNYGKGLCPLAERMHEKELFTHELMRPPMTKEDLNDVVDAFNKVWDLRGDL
jgi:dTDP-4-amino-4,6-dideoxygalactose transaminase